MIQQVFFFFCCIERDLKPLLLVQLLTGVDEFAVKRNAADVQVLQPRSLRQQILNQGLPTLTLDTDKQRERYLNKVSSINLES